MVCSHWPRSFVQSSEEEEFPPVVPVEPMLMPGGHLKGWQEEVSSTKAASNTASKGISIEVSETERKIVID